MVDQAEDNGEIPGVTELAQAQPVQPEPAPHSAEDTTLHLRTQLARYLQNLQGLVSQVSSSCCRWLYLPENLSAIRQLYTSTKGTSVLQEDGNLLIEFPKTFSAQVHLLMESRKHRGVGAIMSDETPPSPEKCARDRLQQVSEADAEKQHDSKGAETLHMVQCPCMLSCGATEEMPLSPSA